MEQSPASVIITDPEGRIEYVNPKFTQVSGYTFEEVKQKNPRVLKSGEADPEFYEQLWKTIKSGGEWTGEFHNRKKNGELYWELASISPIKNRAGEITHFVCVKEDITARRAMEEALRASEEQLRQAQKMESIGTLAGGIAHDFNNILTGILGFTDLAMAEASTAGPAHSHLQQIRQLADRAAALTRQLLTFARRQVLDRECINLNDSVTALSTFLRRVIGEVIDLQLDLAGDLKNVDVDVSQMDQVLVNLCVNARDAMPGGGRLIISTRNVQFKPADVHLPPEAEPGAYVLLAVSDTGIGMDNATRERIFEPFFSTKAVGRGSGLGLSTAYGIIRQQCGSISVQSQPGEGSTFTIYLPAVSGPVTTKDRRHAEPPRPGNETILLVEDEPSVRELVAGSLLAQGYKVITATDGVDAVEVFRRSENRIDLVISDLVMPRSGGLELYQQLRPEDPKLKFIFVSGYSGTKDHERLIKHEGQTFLQKPFSVRDLATKVRTVLDGN